MMPSNDNCSGAIQLNVNHDLNCGTTTAGTVLDATATAYPNPGACTGNFDDDVWFYFIANNNEQHIEISNVVGSTTALSHEVFSGDNCGIGSLSSLYCSDASTSSATNFLPGKTYFIRVATTTATSGQTTTFDICVGRPVGPPANDECNTALLLPMNTTEECTNTFAGTVLNATASSVADVCSGFFDDDVWFAFEATTEIHIINILNIFGSTDNLSHEVLGGTCGELVSRYCSETNRSVATGLTPTKTYFIRIATATPTGGQTTQFDVCVSEPPPPPANDDCDGVITLNVNANLTCSNTMSGTVASATASPIGAGCGPGFDDDVWFNFTATQTSHLISLLNVSGSTTAMTIEVLQGLENCSGLFSVYCGDGEMNPVGGLNIGSNYLIRVATSTTIANQNTTFDVCVGTFPPPPSNDECSGAVALSHTNTCFVTDGNITSATDSGISAPSCGGGPNDDIWYSFEALTPNPNIDVSAAFDGIVELFENSCGSLNSLGCNDFSLNPTFSPAGLNIGTTYYLRVYSTSFFSPVGSNAEFSICVYGGSPPNDICSNAIDVSTEVSNQQMVTGTSLGASNTDAPANDCGGATTPDRGVWFTFTYNEVAPTSYTFNSPDPLEIFVYSGTCGAMTCVPGASGQGTNSCQFSVNDGSGLAATTYYIYVGNSSGSSFDLNISEGSLPLDLKNFSVVADGTLNVLQWETANEMNIRSFGIERSLDGTKDWKLLGEIASLGQSIGAQKYQWSDEQPLHLSYYRLRIEERSGKQFYSNIISLEREEASILNVFPVPITDVLQVQMEADATYTATIELLDVNGRLVKQERINTVKGTNTLTMDVSTISKGVYFLKWQGNGKEVIEKVVK